VSNYFIFSTASQQLCRWIIFHNDSSGLALKVVPHLSQDDGDFGWSASYYSTETLEGTSHNHKLQADPAHNIYVHLDRRMQGVGGYDSWSPNVEPEFIIKRGRSIKTDVTLSPFVVSY
jgi:hypothetical protein